MRALHWKRFEKSVYYAFLSAFTFCSENGEVVADVEEVHVQPNFNPQTVAWDITLFKA